MAYGSINVPGVSGPELEEVRALARIAKETADRASEEVTKFTSTINAIPAQSGSLTYTGGAQSPTWNGYDSNTLTIGGAQSGTNAGTYTATFTPKAGFYWADGTTTAKAIDWTINRATAAIPAQSGSLTYTGGAQSPAWNGYDPNALIIGGAQSGTNAGDYNATFTPNANYQFSDGTTWAKTVTWKINKALGNLSINETSLALRTGALTGIITVSRAGDGAISVNSSSPDVATASVSGNTVTVTGKNTGTATITVNVAEGTNHAAPASKTCSVDVKIYNTTLDSNTWALIKAASDAGIGANFWSVGDTKNVTINGAVGNYHFSYVNVAMFILGFNHNSGWEGGNKIHFQIGKVGGNLVALCDNQYNNTPSSNGYFNMNPNNSNSGGWNACYMRNTLLGNSNAPNSPLPGSLIAALPSDLRAVMKPCTKYSDNTGGGANTASYVTATTDYLFLLAEFEYHGERVKANSAEKNYQAQYDYYKAGNSKVHYRHTDTGTAVYAFCRSAYATDSDHTFCCLLADGSADFSFANYSRGIAPGFCV